MKFTVTFKSPDAVEDAIRNSLTDIADEDEYEYQKEKAEKVCEKFFRWGEYVTVEVDTEAGTCVVVPVS